jgi:hypothetical protein
MRFHMQVEVRMEQTDLEVWKFPFLNEFRNWISGVAGRSLPKFTNLDD